MMRVRELTLAGVVTLGVLFGGALLASPALALYEPSGLPVFGSVVGLNGVAVDRAHGFVYAASGGGRLYKFGAKGAPGNFEFEGAPELVVPGATPALYQVAVDDSSGASKGDIYVADYGDGVVYRYRESGELDGEITVPGVGASVAVDSEGHLFVAEYGAGVVVEYSATGTAMNGGSPVLEGLSEPNAIALNSGNDLYVGEATGTVEFTPNGSGIYEDPRQIAPPNEGHTYGVTVDVESNDVFVDDYTYLQELDEAGGNLGPRFGPPTLQESNAVAVNDKTKTVYAANRAAGGIETYVLVPANTLNVITSGTGAGTVTSQPAGISCGTVCTSEFKEGEEVQLTPEPTSVSEFAGWSGCTSVEGNVCKVTLSADTTVTAEFVPRSEFPLAVADDGTGRGTVMSSPGLIDCGLVCVEEFKAGLNVTLTATPAAGSVFAGWSGACSGTTTCEVTISEALSATAEFTQEPPVVATAGSSSIARITAEVAGTINPNGAPTSECKFEYGTTTSYGSSAACAASPGEGTSPVPVTAALTGLTPNTTYHYRLLAANAVGSNHGTDATFTTTTTPPLIGPAEASAITQSTATITATLEARGIPTRWELSLGSTPGELEHQAAGNTESASALPLELNLASLSPGTVYYYKLIAVNPDGTVETPEASFTTAPAPAPQSATLFSPTPLLSIPNVSFPAEEAGTTTSTPKALTRAQKLAKALKVCRKKAKGKRAACEHQARKRYAPAKK
jgi:hypothetical protein